MADAPYTFIDLFAGCGGLSLGLIKSGLQCKWAVEIDENASETYRQNIGDHIICADIRSIDPNDIPDAEVVVGGFPCQPFSVSGLQHGFEGKDGDLFYQCVRFISNKKPKIFMLENVSGFATLKKGFYLQEALKILSSLGYDVSWKLLDCSEYSIPQVRKRIIILGNRIGAENTYPMPTYVKVSVKDAIDDIWQSPEKYQNNEPMRHSPRIVERFSYVLPGETARDALDRHPELGSAKITKQCYRRMIAEEPAPTIVANFVTTTIHYSQNRNLTAREAARIQTFPDDFVFYGYKTRMSWQKSLSQFEQIGNAVPPRLAELMGMCITEMLNGFHPSQKKQIRYDCVFSEQLSLFSEGVSDEGTNINRGKTHTKRGRCSAYQDVYEEIEMLDKNHPLILPYSDGDDFFIFLKGAMRRRNIDYTVTKNDNGEMVLVRG